MCHCHVQTPVSLFPQCSIMRIWAYDLYRHDFDANEGYNEDWPGKNTFQPTMAHKGANVPLTTISPSVKSSKILQGKKTPPMRTS